MKSEQEIMDWLRQWPEVTAIEVSRQTFVDLWIDWANATAAARIWPNVAQEPPRFDIDFDALLFFVDGVRQVQIRAQKFPDPEPGLSDVGVFPQS